MILVTSCYTVIEKESAYEDINHSEKVVPVAKELRVSDTVKVSKIKYSPEVDSKIQLQYYFYYQPENSHDLRINSLTRILFEGVLYRYFLEGNKFRLVNKEYLSNESIEEIDKQFKNVDYFNTPQFRHPPPTHWPVNNSGIVLSYREGKENQFKHLYLKEPLDSRYKKIGYNVLIEKLMSITKDPKYQNIYWY